MPARVIVSFIKATDECSFIGPLVGLCVAGCGRNAIAVTAQEPWVSHDRRHRSCRMIVAYTNPLLSLTWS